MKLKQDEPNGATSSMSPRTTTKGHGDNGAERGFDTQSGAAEALAKAKKTIESGSDYLGAAVSIQEPE